MQRCFNCDGNNCGPCMIDWNWTILHVSSLHIMNWTTWFNKLLYYSCCLSGDKLCQIKLTYTALILNWCFLHPSHPFDSYCSAVLGRPWSYWCRRNKHDFYFGPQLIKELFMIDSVEILNSKVKWLSGL